jgi:hypothetical protein
LVASNSGRVRVVTRRLEHVDIAMNYQVSDEELSSFVLD